MKKLYFVRHGQSVMNTQSVYAGHSDTPLTDEGRAQAKRAGATAKDFDIDLIISSPLSRAHETAKIIAKEIGYPEESIEVLPELKERNFGILEGTPATEEQSRQHRIIGKKVDVEGLEQIDDLIARGKKVLEHAKGHPSKAKHILLVGHGGIGRALRYHTVPEADYHVGFPNAEIVRWI